MTPWREARDRLLRDHGLAAKDLLGAGDEAEVYALGADRVLKIDKPAVDRALTGRRRALYAALDRSAVPFAVPGILDIGESHGVGWSLETRIAAQCFADLLPRLKGPARQRALLSDADAAAEVRKLRYTQVGPHQAAYGEVLAADAIRADSWADFVLARAGACLAAARDRVAGLVDRPERALDRLAQWLAGCGPTSPDLVHGDFYPANLLTDAQGTVTGLLDFGPLTLMGDATLDLAGAVLYLTGMEGVVAADRGVVRERAREHGLGDGDLAIGRLFLAFRLLSTTRDGQFRWCADVIRSACD